jgi:arsenate reductase
LPASAKDSLGGGAHPPRLAQELAAQGADNETQLNCYRQVRDKIKAFVETLPQSLHSKVQKHDKTP